MGSPKGRELHSMSREEDEDYSDPLLLGSGEGRATERVKIEELEKKEKKWRECSVFMKVESR